MQSNLIKNTYQIEKKLGQGAFGSAFKVLNIKDKKEYVIKEIPLNDASDKEKKAIENEGKLLSKINSEYVVKYYDSFIENSKYYLVMELCDGDSLDNYINMYRIKKQLIPESIVIDIFKQILLGLKKIHEQNIIHRDLKPANIFLSKGLKVKIGDFGVSKETDVNKKYAQTQIGTIIYMSPEVIQGQKYTTKTDIWSVGCILYELCTLNYIFPPSNLIIFIGCILKEKPERIHKMYGRELQHLIDLLLEKDPKKRPDIDMAINEINKCVMGFVNFIDNLNSILEFLLNPKTATEINNMEIEENLQFQILAQSIFSVKKESKLKKALVLLGLAAFSAPIMFIPGLNAAAVVGLSAGVGLIGGGIDSALIIKKLGFINENMGILHRIFRNIIKIIKAEINYKKIENESIIVLTGLKFHEKINEIKDKFKQETYINKLKRKLENNLNIVLLGNTNAGKSTLINSFLKLSEENMAKEGEGVPTDTIDFITYKNEVNGNCYILHDTNGITNTGEHCIAKKMERVQEEINKRIKNGKANKLIHCIWYCIAGPNVQESDKELIEKLHSIYTTKQIPIIFIHTQTFSSIQSKKARAGLKKYLTEIYKDEKKAEDYLNKYYIEVLAKEWEYEVENEETGEIEIKIKKSFGLDKLEKLSKKEIKENGIKSAYFEYLKKDIIPILINAVYTQVFTKENIEQLGEASSKKMIDFIDVLISIINGSDPLLNEKIKSNNEKSINLIYNEFNDIKNKLFNTMKKKLKEKNLKEELNAFIEDFYSEKSEEYKKKYTLEKFKKKVNSKIFDNVENNVEEIINNLSNHVLSVHIVETLKNGLKKQFAAKEEAVLTEIYEQLLKE